MGNNILYGKIIEIGLEYFQVIFYYDVVTCWIEIDGSVGKCMKVVEGLVIVRFRGSTFNKQVKNTEWHLKRFSRCSLYFQK